MTAAIRRPIRLLLAAALLLALGAAALAGVGWYYADALKSGALVPDHDQPIFDLRVVAVDGEKITLEATDETDTEGDWVRDGIFGLEWSGGYGQVGDILERSGETEVRRFFPLTATPAVGVSARLDSFAFPADPLEAHGIGFQEVSYDSPLGEFPAWFIAGERDTWAIFVHGKGADRREALRALPVFRDLGYPALVITYRNDEGVQEGPDGLYRYGADEWEDLEGAVSYAFAHGAAGVVLVGYSMGGGIVSSFLYRSALAGSVGAVVLDAPMLDFEATVDWGARDRFAPWPIKPIGKQIAAWRFDIDWAAVDYLAQAGGLSAPVLLFHGDGDPKVPVSTSDELADMRPDIVTYVRVPGAGHVRSWNADPEAYETALREFLGPVPGVAITR